VFEAEDDPRVELKGVGPTTFQCLTAARGALNGQMIRYDAQDRTGYGHNSNFWATAASNMCTLGHSDLPGWRWLPGALPSLF